MPQYIGVSKVRHSFARCPVHMEPIAQYMTIMHTLCFHTKILCFMLCTYSLQRGKYAALLLPIPQPPLVVQPHHSLFPPQTSCHSDLHSGIHNPLIVYTQRGQPPPGPITPFSFSSAHIVSLQPRGCNELQRSLGQYYLCTWDKGPQHLQSTPVPRFLSSPDAQL